jgi:hypothetical protein
VDTAGKWRRRFAEHRIDGLQDAPRSGPPRMIDNARIDAAIMRTVQSVPAGATQWRSRGMARASGQSTSMWHVHLAPAISSWQNQVERFLALLADNQITRGGHCSVLALRGRRTSIRSFIDQHKSAPKPFNGTNSADDILASIERFCTYNQPPEPRRI